MLNFMFRHGHYTDACILFFPPNALPSLSLSSHGAAIPSSSPQRSDPLATDYGTIDDLCDFCIGYGAMTVLEDVLSARCAIIPEDSAVSQYTTAALVRICNYCETHRHFNYLYKFQVYNRSIMDDADIYSINSVLPHEYIAFDKSTSPFQNCITSFSI